MFQINGPARQPGKTCPTAVTTRQVHPARSSRGRAVHSRSSSSSRPMYLSSAPCGRRRQKEGEDKVIRSSFQHWALAPAETHGQPAAVCTGLHPTQQRTGSDGCTTCSFPTSLLPRAWHGRAGTSWGSQRCRSRAAELLLQGKGEWSLPGSGRSRSGECRELDGHCLGLHPTETSPPVSP